MRDLELQKSIAKVHELQELLSQYTNMKQQSTSVSDQMPPPNVKQPVTQPFGTQFKAESTINENQFSKHVQSKNNCEEESDDDDDIKDAEFLDEEDN